MKLHRTVEYKLHIQWSTSYTEQWSTSYTDSGVQATQTVEYKGSTLMCLGYIVDALKTHVFPLPLLSSKTESRKAAHICTCSEVHMLTIHHTNMLRHNTMGLEENSNRLTGVRPC